MRSALALSAPLLLLLLLLLLPPPSLSQNETSQAAAQSTTAQSTTAQSTQTTTLTTPTQTTAKTTGSQSTTLSTTTSTTPTQKTNLLTKTQMATATPTGNPTATPNTTTQMTTANTTEVQLTGTRTALTPPTQSLTTEVPSKSSRSSTTPNTTAAPSTTTPSSTPQPALSPVPSKPPGSTPEGAKGMPTASCGSGSRADRTFPSSQGTPATRAPLSTTQGTQQTSSKMPAIAGTTASGPAATIPVIRPGIKVDCQPPETLTKTMLILNVTETMSQVLCESKSPPLGDKLATLLCRAAKSTFDPNQDQCHIQLVPGVPGIHALAIQEISIQTNLLPSDVYKLLKDKWDEATAVGVSGMQFGDQGPPEETEDRFSMPLIITIVCMASFLLLVAALYGCCHQRLSQRKDQQRLTEELQTVENGYHDNPTLEVMETSSDMQEKKVVNLNGELGDSWIVPLDNLTKDDLDEEEDTHL